MLSKRATRFRLVPLNAQASAPAGGGNADWIVLHAELEGLKPPVWRRLRVPAKSEVSHHLQMLHVVLQVALGFEDAHLHAFDTLDGRGHVKQTYRTPPPEFSSGWIRTDEREPTSLDLPLAEAFPRIGSKVRYHYDFGDGWTFLLTRVKPEPAEAPGSPHAARGFACLGGGRSGPPEDCGGVHGYLDLLHAHEHPKTCGLDDELIAWAKTLDPETFDPEGVNRELRRL